MAALTLHRGTACSSQAVLHWVLSTHLIHFNHLHMFRIQSRTSDACQCVYVSVLKGTAVVVFNNGAAYTYKNVSRRAITCLLYTSDAADE